MTRGEVWLATLDPTRGSEQGGTRPVLIFQRDLIDQFTTTVITIPFTTNLRRGSLPSCLRVSQGEGGLAQDSVALCHQIRVLDKRRLQMRIGRVSEGTLEAIENRVLFTLGVV